MARTPQVPKRVTALNHEADARLNIATAELADLQQMLEAQEPQPPAVYPRARPLPAGVARERDSDLDPQIVWNGARIRLTKDQVAQLAETGEVEIGDAQLVWRGKDRQDWSDLIVTAPPLYIQEKVHPKAIIDDLIRRSKATRETATDTPDLFADFNGLTDPMARTEFYKHDQHWSNRMILGDSLQVMASLAEREALKGKVQCIFFDPPYGIGFSSNWQPTVGQKEAKSDSPARVTVEPEQVKAFRDTWRDGIHSYLSYLRDRLSVAQELLTDEGSIFVQIGPENVHLIRNLCDEVFGSENFISQIYFRKKTMPFGSNFIEHMGDFIIWYAKKKFDKNRRRFAKYNKLLNIPDIEGEFHHCWFELPDLRRVRMTADELNDHSKLPSDARVYRLKSLEPSGDMASGKYNQEFEGKVYPPPSKGYGVAPDGMERLVRAGRLQGEGKSLNYRLFPDEASTSALTAPWPETVGADNKVYVVQTNTEVVKRCVLMVTDPGDLVLDPTCGSGTTAFVAEQWGRRWITIDTSRVALALARTRLMSARYPFYYLKDSIDGRKKEAEISGRMASDTQTLSDIRQGFVYQRAPHITVGDIAHNAEIDIIWDAWQPKLENLRAELNSVAGKPWTEWEVPRSASGLSDDAKRVHAAWWDARIRRQKEIDASIARAADVEYLYDRPYADPGRVRVAGPFTVESLSPYRIVPADQEELIVETDADVGRSQGRRKTGPLSTSETDFATMVLEHLKTAGVHQTDRDDRLSFTALTPWPGRYVGAEGRFMEGETERRAAILIGPEFGTLSRVDLTAAAREAAESRFDVLIACSFAFDALASELTRLGPLQILKARMNPDLHMAGELKNTGKGNLFTVFGEPDIEIHDQSDGTITVEVKGVDIYDPNTGEVRSSDVKGIAAWFIDTAYNEESFFVRHAYFLGGSEPYKALKTALRAEIDEDAWSTLNKATSRAFERPDTGRIAVKVINHFGDEVMKVFGV